MEHPDPNSRWPGAIACAIVAAHAVAVACLFDPISGLFDAHPLIEQDYGTHFHHLASAREMWISSGRLWGYNPLFMAGYPSGTIQDATGKPTADYSIVIYPSDNRYWVPQARRIQSVRPGTDGKFTFRGLPPGEYRLTAVTDVEPGEWFNPDFLSQLVNASISVTLIDGEKKTQDIRVR